MGDQIIETFGSALKGENYKDGNTNSNERESNDSSS